MRTPRNNRTSPSAVRSKAPAAVFAAVLTASLAGALSLPAGANYGSHRTVQDVARAEVISVDPIVESYRVEVPREVCSLQQVRYDGYDDRYQGRRNVAARSRTPGILGAIIGGAIGHSVGNGKTNKRIGTAVGAVLGGSIGSDISRRSARTSRSDGYRSAPRQATEQYSTERVCEVVADYRTEERISGYDVAYAYGGQTYSTVLDYDPGRYLDVSVSVTPVN